MANVINVSGLTVDSQTDIITALTVAMQGIYGSDINVDSNSPDGQLINIYAQVASDILELLVDIYDTFSVAGAYGTVLDQRVAINGITRRQGTYTTTPVLITVNQALTLNGLDQTATPAFTVADDAGNQFSLLATNVFGGAGSASLTFRAVNVGLVEVTANTITNQVTTILGVTAVNNPTTSGTANGVNEETDAELRIRQTQSFALAATGPADAVEAALGAIPDVTDSFVVENVENTTVNTVPAHSIWCIVTGGTDAEIAQAIYAKKGVGCGMKGSSSFVITRPNGTSFTALWDASISQSLYIEFTINPKTIGQSFDIALLADQLAAELVYKLGQSPTVGDVVSAMQTLAPTAYLTDIGVSKDDVSFFDVVAPNTAQYYYTVDAANIHITQ